MKKLFFLFAIATLFLTSCETGEIKSEMKFSRNMAIRAVSSETGLVTASSSRYSYDMDLIKLTMTITLNDLKLAPSMEKTTLVLKNIPFKSTKDGFAIAQDAVIPEVNGVAAPQYTLNNLTALMYSENEITLNYRLGAQYSAYSTIKDPAYLYATTTVIDTNQIPADAKPYISEGAVYEVKMDIAKMVADINIYKVKFADKMPASDIRIVDIPVIATATGYSLAIDKATPLIGNTPFPSYEITNLTATMYGTTLNMHFICAGKYNTSVVALMHKPVKEDK